MGSSAYVIPVSTASIHSSKITIFIFFHRHDTAIVELKMDGKKAVESDCSDVRIKGEYCQTSCSGFKRYTERAVGQFKNCRTFQHSQGDSN